VEKGKKKLIHGQAKGRRKEREKGKKKKFSAMSTMR